MTPALNGPHRPSVLHAHGVKRMRRTVVAIAIALASAGGCSSDGDKDESASTTAAGSATLPPGPSLCQRLDEAAASRAVGFPLRKAGDGTSVSCVYTSGDAAHTGTVLSVTASDAAGNTDALVAAARSSSSAFSEVDGLGDAAYVATVNGLPQGAVIEDGRQYSVALSTSPPLGERAAKTALTELLKAVHSGSSR